MVDRPPDNKLIPPGINDERTRVLLGAFMHAASMFDFSALLMRNGSEITDDMLELALHDFSLSEFVDADGLPAAVIRNLIDQAWELHEKQGTDGGVKVGQELLGYRASIAHWWQQDPEGAHDTNTIDIEIRDALFVGEDPLSMRTQAQIARMVDATKRWSQDTNLRMAITADVPAPVAVVTASGAFTSLLPHYPTEIECRAENNLASVTHGSSVSQLRPQIVSEIVLPPASERLLATLVIHAVTLKPLIRPTVDLPTPINHASAMAEGVTTTTILPQ